MRRLYSLLYNINGICFPGNTFQTPINTLLHLRLSQKHPNSQVLLVKMHRVYLLEKLFPLSFLGKQLFHIAHHRIGTTVRIASNRPSRFNALNHIGIKSIIFQIIVRAEKDILGMMDMQSRKKLPDFIFIAMLKINLIGGYPLLLIFVFQTLIQKILGNQRNLIGRTLLHKIAYQRLPHLRVFKNQYMMHTGSVQKHIFHME